MDEIKLLFLFYYFTPFSWAGATQEVTTAISCLNTLGLSVWGREIGVKLHQPLTLMQSWECDKVPQVVVKWRETAQVYRASLEA